MENKRKHLEMIQSVINRLAQSSFLLKGWSVVLVSALFALAAGNSKPQFFYLPCFPVIAFWILDGYFLQQECLFRALYDHVRTLEEKDINFSMDTSVVKDQVSSWRDVILSKSLFIFHGTLIASIIVVILITVSGS